MTLRIDNDLTFSDRIVARVEGLALGTFHAAPGTGDFDQSGPYACHYLVFPRSSTRIQPRGERSFVGSPALLCLYGPGDCLSRSLVSEEGDLSDYVAFDGEMLALAMKAQPSSPRQPPPVAWPPARTLAAPDGVVARMRRLFADVRARGIGRIELEEKILPILRDVCAGPTPVLGPRTGDGRRIVEEAKSLLAATFTHDQSLRSVASVLHVDPCHLSRSFSHHAGMPLHQYVVRLRVAAACELLASDAPSIARVATQLGFTHQSHLGWWFRRVMGITPAMWQRLAGPGPCLADAPAEALDRAGREVCVS